MTMSKRDTYTPESLLAVAVQVFNERGYDGTSMEHLSQAAGISKSSIYHHVRGKEELLDRAVGRALTGLFAILDEPDAREGRAVDRLEHVTRRTVEVLVEELPYVTLLLRVRGNTGTERTALERRREFDQWVADLLGQAVLDGDLRGDLDARLATRLLFGMINSVVEWYRPLPRDGGEGVAGHESHDGRPAQDAWDGERIADAVVRLAFDGLRVPDRPA
jgi:AcrR family transcriptional regulator